MGGRERYLIEKRPSRPEAYNFPLYIRAPITLNNDVHKISRVGWPVRTLLVEAALSRRGKRRTRILHPPLDVNLILSKQELRPTVRVTASSNFLPRAARTEARNEPRPKGTGTTTKWRKKKRRKKEEGGGGEGKTEGRVEIGGLTRKKNGVPFGIVCIVRRACLSFSGALIPSTSSSWREFGIVHEPHLWEEAETSDVTRLDTRIRSASRCVSQSPTTRKSCRSSLGLFSSNAHVSTYVPDSTCLFSRRSRVSRVETSEDEIN